MGKLAVLMITAFVDMMGLLMVVPLLPFYALRLGGGGFIIGVLVSSFSVAQLISAPLWGRVSDRFGRRPALLIGLGSAAGAYVIFAYADSLWLLLLSRVVQGAGGGTVGVIQAYVTDVTEPGERAKGLGWLSAATSAGVMIGPAIGAFTFGISPAAPGLTAAGLCLANMLFAMLYLRESRVHHVPGPDSAVPTRPRAAVWQVLTRPAEPAPRVIWIYAVAMGAFHGMTAILVLFLAMRFGITEKQVALVFIYNGAISVIARGFLLGKALDRFGEVSLARIGMVMLAVGLTALPFTTELWMLALAIGLVPLGTAFTFPCVTSILSRLIHSHERGVFMGVQQSFGGAARVVAPLWTGWAWDHLGPGIPFWTGAAAVALTLVLGLGVRSDSAVAVAAARG